MVVVSVGGSVGAIGVEVSFVGVLTGVGVVDAFVEGVVVLEFVSLLPLDESNGSGVISAGMVGAVVEVVFVFVDVVVLVFVSV